jgi:hypothetical protein
MVQLKKFSQGDDDGRSTNASEALELLLSGKAELEDVQSNPPTELLELFCDHLKKHVSGLPSVESARELQIASNALIVGGVAQNIVEGHGVTWVRPGGHFLSRLECLVLHRPQQSKAISQQIQDVMNKYRRGIKCREYYSRRVCDAEAQEQRLVRVQVENVIYGKGTPYVRFREDWYAMYRHLEEFVRSREKLLKNCLADGRVLLSEKTPSGDVLVAPDQAAGYELKCLSSKESDFSACLFDDLPSSVLGVTVHSDIAKKRANAADWIVRVCRHFENESRRVTRSQLIDEAQGRFKLSENAAKTALKNAIVTGDLELKRGALKVFERVKGNEIKKIK